MNWSVRALLQSNPTKRILRFVRCHSEEDSMFMRPLSCENLNQLRFRWLRSAELLSFGLIISFCWCVFSIPVLAAERPTELFVGGATVSITPDRPVALWGQMHTRISKGVESPVTATVLVLESRSGSEVHDEAVMVACDLVAIPTEALEQTRLRVQERLPQLPVEKIFLSATHTHTAPVMLEGVYEIPKEVVMQPSEYVAFFADRVADAIVTAWNSRKSGTVSWGLGYAAVAKNRRSVYEDATAVMYGQTNVSRFRMIEGYEDHGVESLFFWDDSGNLIATAINVACPAQEVEGNDLVSADFWHHVRKSLQSEYGANLHVLGWTGAAGDQSPHLMIRKQAEERMRKLRGLSRLEEISSRIVLAWKESLAAATQDRHANAILVHRVQKIELPRRPVTQREWELAKSKIKELSTEQGKQTLLWWHGEVVRRYEEQQAATVEPFVMELHVIRLGDIAIATNSFELFTDFGIAMKARSPALQTFVIQLTGPGTYLPSARAVGGGGYSAIVESNAVGPEAGQGLVDRTIDHLNELWSDSPREEARPKK